MAWACGQSCWRVQLCPPQPNTKRMHSRFIIFLAGQVFPSLPQSMTTPSARAASACTRGAGLAALQLGYNSGHCTLRLGDTVQLDHRGFANHLRAGRRGQAHQDARIKALCRLHMARPDLLQPAVSPQEGQLQCMKCPGARLSNATLSSTGARLRDVVGNPGCLSHFGGGRRRHCQTLAAGGGFAVPRHHPLHRSAESKSRVC